MKSTLEFDLNDYDDKARLQHALNGEKYAMLIREFHADNFRQLLKYDTHHNQEMKDLYQLLGLQGQRLVELLAEEFNSHFTSVDEVD